jgi:predicted transcriptional regulator
LTGTDLREWRARVGLTQRALAAMTGVSVRTIKRMEAGDVEISRAFALALETVEARLARARAIAGGQNVESQEGAKP